jgi:predicted SprT family Zn-dependent metalloprotease
MFWFKKKDKFDQESSALSLIQGVPDGFFRCKSCNKVSSTTQFETTVWEGKEFQYLCKKCFSEKGENKTVETQE